MSRGVLGLDRFVALVLGLALIAFGVAVGAWGLGQLTRLWASAPEQITTTGARNVLEAPWWTAAAAVGSVVLGLLGLWWLLAHVPRRSTGPLRLTGSDRSGELLVDASSAARTAAEVLTETPGVRSASGKVVSDRGQLIAEMSVTAEPSVDLAELAEVIEATTADLNIVLGRADLRGRVAVHIARRQRSQPRVH